MASLFARRQSRIRGQVSANRQLTDHVPRDPARGMFSEVLALPVGSGRVLTIGTFVGQQTPIP